MINKTTFNQFLVILLIGSILAYLSIRGITNIGIICLGICGIFLLFKNDAKISTKINQKYLILIFIGFSSIFLSTLAAQIFKNPLQASSFDGPLRILLGFFIFTLFLQVQNNLLRALTLTIPTSLIILFISLTFFDHHFIANWGGRYASYFVDPNTLGGQTSILSILCLYLFLIDKYRNQLVRLILLTGFIVGFSMMFHAQSRGGWLAFTMLLLLTLFFVFKQTKVDIRSISKVDLSFFALLTIYFAYFIYDNYTDLLSRLAPITNEIVLWKDGGENLENTSVGARLGIWEVSFLLIQESLLFGFGERNLTNEIKIISIEIPTYLAGPMAILLGTGPHSDMLAKLLANGVIGLLAYFCTVGIPFYFFTKFQVSKNTDVMIASRLGILYLAGVFICGLFNETLSLKYLCSFYALIVAALLAIALHPNNSTNHELK